MKINIFTPPTFTKQSLDIEYLNNITNKQWQYTVNGRASIYHIIKSLNIDKILIPAYVCDTVLVPLKKLNITPVFYDLEVNDLNASLESIKDLTEKYNVKTLLVASMYGNPASLIKIEQYCKQNNIFLIDDAAQSFGAKLDNRYIGTFGDAGFFSFSPGKPTAGHMGSFFWSKDKIKITRTNHFLTHYFRWLDFYFNRYKIYNSYSKLFTKTINIISRILLKVVNIDNDKICKFEEDILGGILSDNLDAKFDFRGKHQERFVVEFEDSKYFKVIINRRGIANNHKIVLVFYKQDTAQNFINYMFVNDIYVINGYKLLTSDLKYLPNAKNIQNKVVELPIESNGERMNYLFKKVREFEN